MGISELAATLPATEACLSSSRTSLSMEDCANAANPLKRRMAESSVPAYASRKCLWFR